MGRNTKKSLVLKTKDIKDEYVREAFEFLRDFFNPHPLSGTYWEFHEKEFTAAVTNERIAHTLGGVPKDIILTSKTGAGSVTFEYEDFDRNFIYVSTTGAAKIRFMAGSYVRGRR